MQRLNELGRGNQPRFTSRQWRQSKFILGTGRFLPGRFSYSNKKILQVGHKPGNLKNLEYSGISLNVENSGNS